MGAQRFFMFSAIGVSPFLDGRASISDIPGDSYSYIPTKKFQQNQAKPTMLFYRCDRHGNAPHDVLYTWNRHAVPKGFVARGVGGSRQIRPKIRKPLLCKA